MNCALHSGSAQRRQMLAAPGCGITPGKMQFPRHFPSLPQKFFPE
jgi:hypothetical protein